MELLGLWQNIHREVVQLAETVEKLPDGCECGDADAHLEDRCACCDIHRQAGPGHARAESCDSLLARLRADLTMLSEDVAIAAPPMEAAALEKQRFELRRGVFLAVSDLQRIIESFKKVTEAVAGFRRDCAVSRMRAIKHHCAELRQHCDEVNSELVGE